LALAGAVEGLHDLSVAYTVRYLLCSEPHQTVATGEPESVLIWLPQLGLERFSILLVLKAFAAVVDFAHGLVTLLFLVGLPPFALLLDVQSPFVTLPQP
jgi:hypothetical protein